jgi:hypothetical protein
LHSLDSAGKAAAATTAIAANKVGLILLFSFQREMRMFLLVQVGTETAFDVDLHRIRCCPEQHTAFGMPSLASRDDVVLPTLLTKKINAKHLARVHTSVIFIGFIYFAFNKTGFHLFSCSTALKSSPRVGRAFL